jgi:hypothetical protein
VTTFRGSISAKNVAEGGVQFVVRLPLSVSVGKFNKKWGRGVIVKDEDVLGIISV